MKHFKVSAVPKAVELPEYDGVVVAFTILCERETKSSIESDSIGVPLYTGHSIGAALDFMNSEPGQREIEKDIVSYVTGHESLRGRTATVTHVEFNLYRNGRYVSFVSYPVGEDVPHERDIQFHRMPEATTTTPAPVENFKSVPAEDTKTYPPYQSPLAVYMATPVFDSRRYPTPPQVTVHSIVFADGREMAVVCDVHDKRFKATRDTIAEANRAAHDAHGINPDAVMNEPFLFRTRCYAGCQPIIAYDVDVRSRGLKLPKGAGKPRLKYTPPEAIASDDKSVCLAFGAGRFDAINIAIVDHLGEEIAILHNQDSEPFIFTQCLESMQRKLVSDAVRLHYKLNPDVLARYGMRLMSNFHILRYRFFMEGFCVGVRDALSPCPRWCAEDIAAESKGGK